MHHISYKKQIFPIHIFHAHIKENDLIKESLLSKIKKIYDEEDLEIPDGWHTSKLSTTFGNETINEELFGPDSIIHQIYPLYIDKFFDKPSVFSLRDIWMNYYDDGEYQEKHIHIGPCKNMTQPHFSLIHYLKFDPEVHQSTTFIDPLDVVRLSSLEMESNYYRVRYRPKIGEGSILMFPSYLEHMVEKSKPTPNNPRITIAFNINVLEYGEEEGEESNEN